MRQLDPALENFVGISAQRLQPVARIGALIQISRADSQIATVLAVRELHFAVIFNEFSHFPDPHACIYKVRTKKEFSIPTIPLVASGLLK
jgi:hypothetical protein